MRNHISAQTALLLSFTFALALLTACGSSSSSGAGNGAPSITSLSPSSTGAGGADFPLTVNGTGFITSSAVEWNGSARTTTFISATQLQAQISASDITTGGTATVTVANPGGGTSRGVPFTINSNAGLLITSLDPPTSLAGDQLTDLTVNGTGFVSGSIVQWDGIARPTTFIS